MGEAVGSLSMAGHMMALECPCGWVQEPALRVEYSLEELGCSVVLAIGKTLQGEDSFELEHGSPKLWPASVHDRLQLVAAWWNSWAGGRLLEQGCKDEGAAEGAPLRLRPQQT